MKTIYKKYINKISVVIIGLLFVPGIAFAQAKLFISPTTGTYSVGELFTVLVNLNSGGEPINAATAQINYDNTRLDVVSLGFSKSIFSLWVEEPSYSNAAGSIKFSGGSPNPGFNGASGSIIRITFRSKAVGKAPIEFLSGSVLANDGKGTNILDGMTGASFNIQTATVETKATPVIEQKGETNVPIESPIFTDFPKQLNSGEVLTIKGLSLPNSKVAIFLQKGSEEPTIYEIHSKVDGRFEFISTEPVKAGFYRIWARSTTLEGLSSGNSEVLTIEVLETTAIRIGKMALNYMTVFVTLFAMSALLILIILFIWFKLRRWQKKQGVEISEAEDEVHKSFDKVKDGLGRYVDYLLEGKTPDAIRKRERQTKGDLNDELEALEKRIKKEIEDIKNPPKKDK
ncbi:MAG: cohesin domain-containing protein [Candidatus Paceibacterota bacterium]